MNATYYFELDPMHVLMSKVFHSHEDVFWVRKKRAPTMSRPHTSYLKLLTEDVITPLIYMHYPMFLINIICKV